MRAQSPETMLNGTVGGTHMGLLSLLSANAAQVVKFVTAELGSELTADTDAMLRLRATIEVYLDARLSPSPASYRPR